MGLETNPNAPCPKEILPNGQQKCYLVLSEEERAKGFVMPVHRGYTHLKCGTYTSMGLALCETYARDPKFYGGTFCCACGSHFNLFGYTKNPDGTIGEWTHNFEWPDGTPVGASPDEAEEYHAKRKAKEAERLSGGSI